MKHGTGKTALVTGATSGIGRELAKLLAEDGFGLILVARSRAELDECAHRLEAKGTRVITLAKDLSMPGAAEELYGEVRGRVIEVDVLVNDAGQGEYGPFLDAPLARHREILTLNLAAVTELCWLFGRDMRARGSGRILNLASIVSKMPCPLLAVYGATKAYVFSLSEALHDELRGSGVTVTALMPGATATDFFRKAGGEDTRIAASKKADPAEVAHDGYAAMMAGDDHVISGAMNKAQGLMSRMLPDSVLAAGMRKQNEKRGG